MTDLPPVWLLDIDGVINAISRKPDRSVWPAEQWITGTANSDGTDWPILAARPVVDFIRRVHEQGRAEIRWHTTWQKDAANLAKLLDLPEMSVQDAPEFREPNVGLVDGELVRRPWWKLAPAERVLADGRALVWTDDDADLELRWADRDRLAVAGQVLVVSPRTNLGLTPKHLRQIDAFLRGGLSTTETHRVRSTWQRSKP